MLEGLGPSKLLQGFIMSVIDQARMVVQVEDAGMAVLVDPLPYVHRYTSNSKSTIETN